MNFRLITATGLLALATVALADDTFNRTFSVSAQPDLYVSTGSGNIRIFPGSGNEIHITGHVHAGWSAFGDVNSRIRRIVENPPITQNGNEVRVGEAPERNLFNNISIDYEVQVPTGVALNLHSGSGDIEVDHVGRYLSASDGSGSVRAHGAHGPADLETGSGDIELEEEGPGDIKAKTGSGSIRIHGFDGAFRARTGSGDIEADGRLQGPATLESGSGSVHLHLPSDSRFNFEAATGSGDIRVNFPGLMQTADSSRHHLTIAVNGGGPALEAHTGSGDIEVTAR